jgi:hypothetical protein
MVNFNKFVVVLTIYVLFICVIYGYGINENEDSKSLLMSVLRMKRLPCEIRDPFTGGCAIPGPRSPF